MRSKLKKIGLIFALSGIAQAAQAYNCVLTITDVSIAYSPTAASNTSATGSFRFTCTRASTTSDPAILNWDLAANSGFYSTSTVNQVQRTGGTDRYDYELYRNPSFTDPNRWQLANGLRFTGTLNFGTALTASQPATTFHVNFPAPQTPLQPAGLYIDFVNTRLSIDTTTTILAQTSFQISATTQKECLLTPPAGNLSFTYVSFQALPAPAIPTTFQVRCTQGTTYSIALSAPSSTLLGLSYNLLMSTNPGNVAVPSSTSGTGRTGSGSAQNFNIRGSIAGGQAGICPTGSCNATQVQTLTITF